jgi:hypothetical protein
MAIGLIVFACVSGGALSGMILRRALPEHHLTSESRDVVKLGTGLVATMAALVLSLLIASAKTSYEAERAGLERMSATVILLGSILAHFGTDGVEARDVLRRAVATTLERRWSANEARSPGIDAPEANRFTRALYDAVQAITPHSDAQRSMIAQAQQLTLEIRRTRWLLIEEEHESSIPMPFLVVLAFWLTFLFVSFGLHAPPNATVVATLLLCALSVSGAIFLILELDHPFDGLMQLSSTPLRDALARLAE